MNKKVYIVSICLKKKADDQGESIHEFHFKGFYQGFRVKKLLISGGDFEPYEEYLLQARIIGFEGGTLRCKCLKWKAIFNH